MYCMSVCSIYYILCLCDIHDNIIRKITIHTHIYIALVATTVEVITVIITTIDSNKTKNVTKKKSRVETTRNSTIEITILNF